MAQITGSRTEFMTSDLGLSDIEYKRKGGCFVSHKRTALIILIFIVLVIVAGVIGAYISPWGQKQAITAMNLSQDDEIDEPTTSTKFSVSPSILPTLYTIDLTPVMEKGVVKRFEGRVVIRFTYNETQPLTHIVLNAIGINVSKTKLFSHDHQATGNVRSRRRRADQNSEPPKASSDQPVATGPPVTANAATTSVANLSSEAVQSSNSTKIGTGAVSTSTDGHTTTDAVSVLISTTEKVSSEKEDDGSTASGEQPGKISPKLPDVDTQGTEINVASNETDSVDGFYVLYPGTPIQRGAYSVEITYEAGLDGISTFVNTYEVEGQKRWLLGTNLKPFGARTLFPGFDDPSSRARFSLSVARPKSFMSLANTPLQSSDAVSGDWAMDHFEKSPPLASNNLAFLIGELESIGVTTVEDTKIPLWGGNRKMNETRLIAGKIGTVTKILSEFFSIPLYLPKLDVVAMPGLITDGLGSTGLISIRESLFYVTDESSEITKELAIKNLIKLIGEQWLGGLIGVRTWSDAWILEGSLIYLQHLFADKVDSSVDSYSSFGIVQHTALEADAYAASKALESKLSPPILDTSYPRNTFRKGACLIRMLHNVISDSGLGNGYKKFLSRWNITSPGVSDFWNSMSDEAHWLPDGVSLAEVMTSWVAQAGFPVVTVTRNESGSAIVRQEQFTYDNATISKPQFWYVPLTYITEGSDWSTPRKSWLKQEEEVTLDDVGKGEDKRWVLFNVNQTGYYRVNYDLDNWKLLSSALNSTFERFPVTVRTSLVDDALSLAWAGRLGYPTALDLIRYLADKETHHSPWTVAFQNMVKLNNLLHSTAAYSSFQEFMIKFISPLFKKVTSTSGETRLKLMAIKWACLIDNPECSNYVKSLETVPQYLEETVQCTLAKFGGKSVWDSMLQKTLNAENRETKLRLLAALPCFQIEWILETLLNEILKGERFDAAETLVLLNGIGQNPMAARSAFKFVRRHWNDVHQRFSKSYPIAEAFLVASMNGITDDQDLKDFQSFKAEYFDKLNSMGHAIAVAEAEARSRSSWLKENLVVVQGWLENYTKPS